MENLKKALPFAGIYYVLMQFYLLYLNLTIEHSFVFYVLSDLAELRLTTLLKPQALSTLLSPVIGVVLLAGLIRYFRQKQAAINQLIELGLGYFVFAYFFQLPLLVNYLFGNAYPYSQSPTWKSYLLGGLAFVVMTMVLIYFIRQNAAFQKNRFPEREKSYGPSPYEEYLQNEAGQVGWKRLFNYAWDWLFAWALVFPAVVDLMENYQMEPPLGSIQLVIAFSFFLYCFVLEAFSGRTLGKIITGTVVQFQGMPSVLGALARSLCRLIPFEPLSFLAHKGYGWHDQFSGTYVERVPDQLLSSDPQKIASDEK